MKAARVSRYACLALAGLLLAVPMHGKAQPVITVPPTNKTVRVGETAFFTVTATGTPPLTYQWRKDGEDIPGATGPTLVLGLARADHSAGYSVDVADALGSITSVVPARLTIVSAPDSAMVGWGLNDFGQTAVVTLPPHEDIVAIAAGWRHSAALSESGVVRVWGDGGNGQTQVPVAASN